MKAISILTNLAMLQRLKACYHSNNDGRAARNPILMFQCPKSCFARCLAHHYFNWTLRKTPLNPQLKPKNYYQKRKRYTESKHPYTKMKNHDKSNGKTACS